LRYIEEQMTKATKIAPSWNWNKTKKAGLTALAGPPIIL